VSLVSGSATVTVVKPPPSLHDSLPISVNVSPSTPVPTLSSLSPSSATAGGAAFTLTVTGTNFVSSSVVQWNGAPRTTTFVSSTQLTAAIGSSHISVAGSAQVTVDNPAP